MKRRNRRSERGSALFVAVLMLVMMGFLGVAALETVSRDREVAGLQNRSRTAFYAAEAGLANARQVVHSQLSRSNPTPLAFPDVTNKQTIGDTVLYDQELGNLPRYYGDPNPTLPDPCVGGPSVCYWKKGVPAADAGVKLNTGSGAMFIWDLYRINVVGESPDGSRSRLEAAEVKLISDSGYATGGAAYGGGG